MDPATIVAGALGAAQTLGGVLTNEQNRKLSHQQMDFQERMSSTAWQRGVTDMRAAGINPMLAVSQGSASAPSGSSTSMENPISPGVSSALALAQAKANIALQEQNIATSQSQERLNDHTAANLAVQTANSGSETNIRKALAGFVDKGISAFNNSREAIGRHIGFSAYDLKEKVKHTLTHPFDATFNPFQAKR